MSPYVVFTADSARPSICFVETTTQHGAHSVPPRTKAQSNAERSGAPRNGNGQVSTVCWPADQLATACRLASIVMSDGITPPRSPAPVPPRLIIRRPKPSAHAPPNPVGQMAQLQLPAPPQACNHQSAAAKRSGAGGPGPPPARVTARPPPPAPRGAPLLPGDCKPGLLSSGRSP